MKKKNNLKVRALLCIICLFVLVYLPSVEGRVIEYPKEDGPYTIYISGRKRGPSTIEDKEHLLPFWNLDSNQYIGYDIEGIAFLIVNGSLQDIKYPARIVFWGFKGFAPPFWMLFFIFRIRVFGKCESITVVDDI